MFLELDGWKTEVRFAAAHFIPSHDKCSRLHGHDYGVRARVHGVVKDSFIVDFLELRRIILEIIDPIDHRVIVPIVDGISSHREEGNQVIVEYQGKKFSFFLPDVYYLNDTTSSSEALAKQVGSKLWERLSPNENVSRIELSIDEGPGMGAWVEIHR